MATRSATPLVDAEARRRIREDLAATLFVEAAAGTGKTRALVSRVVSLLRSGQSGLDRIAAVTFTEKAAGEMKLRLRAEIEAARIPPDTPRDEREALERALSQLELARIGTIHAFCGDLLHERPVEAGVDPLFEVSPADESERLLDLCFDDWFQEVLAEPPEGVRRMLRRRPRGRDRLGPREQLRSALRSLVEHRDFPAAWRRVPRDREAEIDGLMRELGEVSALAERAPSGDDWLGRNLAELARFCAENALREQVRGRDYDALEAELRELARSSQTHWHWRGALRRPFAPGLPRADVIARRDAVKQRLDGMLAAADADLAALLREELRPAVERYEVLKKRTGRLDFLDLLVRARDLIRDDAVVRAELQARFTHFFVDEFQDTDPLQVEILMLLAAEDPSETDWRRTRPVPGKLFLVGDPKQSIYRFRRAEVSIYEDAKRQLREAGAEVLQLTTSFRSLPELQVFVNAAFSPLMRVGADGSQAEYVALEPYREAVADRPSVVALPVPRPYGDYGRIANFRIEESLPDAVGAYVDWLVNQSGWTIESPEDAGVRIPLEARHVCLLFRRFKSFGNDVTRPYVRALEARRVPHVLVGGRSFHEREEVQAIRNALCAIEWPDDELRVFATLRGPFFALGDDALLAYRKRVGRFHALRRVDADALAALDEPEREVVAALSILAALHRHRNRRPLAVTLSRLLEAVRAHAGIAIWPTGEQALANCLRVIDLARRYERRGAPSFRAFVEYLESEAESGEAEDAPVVEEGTEGVRIMTVHRAKGLEFPVVVLADPTAAEAPRNPSRHIDPERGLWAEPLCGCTPLDLLDAADLERARDAAEAIRVAYVAATRARELLVVPVVGDEERPGWLSGLNPALYPDPTRRRESETAPGCPDFGEDSVFDRGPGSRKESPDSVRPGLHVPREGSHPVVWWDPACLELDCAEQVGLRQERILVADEAGTADDDGIRAHERWWASRSATLESGARPSLDVRPVTLLAAEPPAAEGAVAAEEVALEEVAPEEVAMEEVAMEEVAIDRAARPGGRRFGSLVHAVLASVDLRADAAQVRTCARVQRRLLGASEEEGDAAAVAVVAALAHPLLQRAADAADRGGLRRETPVMLKRDDGILAEGIVDLAFREQADSGSTCWTVVDFKTDREIESQRERYEAQVRLYAEAVRTATEEPVRGVLMLI